MRKCFILMIGCILLLTACAGSGSTISENGDGIIEIGERFFVMQVTEIQLNAQDYLGRTIRFEGIFSTEYSAPTSSYFHIVTRNTYGCCGDDGVVGFEVYMPEGLAPFPDDTWVSVTGVLEQFEYQGMDLFRLAATHVEEAAPGAGFVSS